MDISAFAWRVCGTCREEDIFPLDETVTITRLHKRPGEPWRLTLRGVYPDAATFIRDLEEHHIYLKVLVGGNKDDQYEPVCDITNMAKKEVWIDGLTPPIPGGYDAVCSIVAKAFCDVEYYVGWDPVGDTIAITSHGTSNTWPMVSPPETDYYEAWR